jgi:hypothetical protein
MVVRNIMNLWQKRGKSYDRNGTIYLWVSFWAM